LATVDAVMDNMTLTEAEAPLEASLLMDYEEHLKNEEIVWR